MRLTTFYLKWGRQQVAFSAFPFSQNYYLLFFPAVVLYFCHTCIEENIRKRGERRIKWIFASLVSFLSPVDFCEMIKAIYQDSKKRFKTCLSSGVLLVCLSLFFHLSFTASVASLARDYNNHTCSDSPGTAPHLQLLI